MTCNLDPGGISATGVDHLANTKSSLLIEVQLDNTPFSQRDTELEEHVREWLKKSFSQLIMGQCFDLSTATFNHANHVVKMKVTGTSTPTRAYPDNSIYQVKEHDLSLFLYRLHEAAESEIKDQYTVRPLPNEVLEDQWDRLIFDDAIAEDVLRTLVRSKALRDRIHLRRWLNNVLFFGPPGTGKTTLALGLAQKLSIRLQDSYEEVQHVQVNSHALLSKFFGESSKEVGKLFDDIYEMASNPMALIIVTFDEIESIVASRQRATDKKEVEDAIRSTNEFLRGLDKLNEVPNIIFFATSNLAGNMDEAFMDRFNYKELINRPARTATFEILRRTVSELLENGFVYFDPTEFTDADDDLRTLSTNGQLQVLLVSCLEKLAHAAEDSSARSLEERITLAICKYTTGEQCSLRDLLAAFEKVFIKTESKDAPRDEIVRSVELDVAHSQRPEEAIEQEQSDNLHDPEAYQQWIASLGA